jgi:hypothetical protein
MLSDAIVLEIRRLLGEGRLSWRAIGRQLGVSRGVVGNVAKGRRGIHSTPMFQKCERDRQDPLPTRCRGCGGRVYKPCRLCRTRAHQGRMRLIRQVAGVRPSEGPISRCVA